MSATALRRFWFWQTIAWLALIPVSFVTGIANAVWFVTLISLIALALASASSWQASRAEVKVDQVGEVRD